MGPGRPPADDLGPPGAVPAPVAFQREVLTTPDDDDLMLDHVTGPADAPRVLLLHGLEGSAHSVYIQGLARPLARRRHARHGAELPLVRARPGHTAALPNRRPRLYHSGETGDLDFVVETLRSASRGRRCWRSGVSLGGNVLLKWLGEKGARSPDRGGRDDLGALRSRGGVEAPRAAAGRFYASHFLKTLKRKALDVMTRFPRETEHMDADRIRVAETFFAFDDTRRRRCTASQRRRLLPPLELAARTSRRSRCRRCASAARTIRSSRPRRSSAPATRRRTTSTLAVSPWGGHAASPTAPRRGRPRYWAEEASVSWLAPHLS